MFSLERWRGDFSLCMFYSRTRRNLAFLLANVSSIFKQADLFVFLAIFPRFYLRMAVYSIVSLSSQNEPLERDCEHQRRLARLVSDRGCSNYFEKRFHLRISLTFRIFDGGLRRSITAHFIFSIVARGRYESAVEILCNYTTRIKPLVKSEIRVSAAQCRDTSYEIGVRIVASIETEGTKSE